MSADKPLIVPVTDAEMLSGDWASCVSQAKANNLEIATARQIAELRMKHGRDSDYCTKGGWVAENFNYLPDGNIYIASRDFNPLFLFAEEATKAHAAGKEFFPYGGYLQGIFDAEKQGKALLLKRKDVPDEISVDAFGKEPLTAFIGWNQDYGEFLDSCGIKKIKLYVAEEKYAKNKSRHSAAPSGLTTSFATILPFTATATTSTSSTTTSTCLRGTSSWRAAAGSRAKRSEPWNSGDKGCEQRRAERDREHRSKMTYTPKLLQEYIECERALKEAEKLLDSGSPDANAISRLEMILSADTDAMAMIRMHREYGQKLPVILERLTEKR